MRQETQPDRQKEAKTMTSQQRSDLGRALDRATHAGIRIAAHGTRRSDGSQVWGVTSKSQHASGTLHVVLLPIGGHALLCDCATRLPAVCMHRALVHQALVDARQAEQTARYQELSAWDESQVA
jgi:hypothetical protein